MLKYALITILILLAVPARANEMTCFYPSPCSEVRSYTKWVQQKLWMSIEYRCNGTLNQYHFMLDKPPKVLTIEAAEGVKVLECR